MIQFANAAWLTVVAVLFLPVHADEPKAADGKSRYEFRDDHDPDGIGKFYMGREIAQVMGYQAAGWLERPEREKEEHCSKLLEALKLKDEDEQVGVNIVKRAIEEPTRALAENAGVEGSVVVQEVKRRKGNEGYNVATNEYEDLVKAGVVDPKKVTRAALQNAGSIAGLLLTTECLVSEVPEIAQ